MKRNIVITGETFNSAENYFSLYNKIQEIDIDDMVTKFVFADTSENLAWVRRDKNNLGIVRKDIYLVSTATGENQQDAYINALSRVKSESINLVYATYPLNDNNGKTGSMIVAPEEAAYEENSDISALYDMVTKRSQLTFTQSSVVEGKPVPWLDTRIPATLREVVDYCRGAGAYKEFKGVTAGHFAVKLSDTEFLTSIRRTNFNDLDKIGLVYVKTDGPDSVIAYGAKPSVGGQSQRIVFNDHAGYDCIVHFHCKQKDDSSVPVKEQRDVECGSHQCGKNTSDGLKDYGLLKAVMLKNHGPNIVFSSSADPGKIIDFINEHWDLSSKTGGYNIA